MPSGAPSPRRYRSGSRVGWRSISTFVEVSVLLSVASDDYADRQLVQALSWWIRFLRGEPSMAVCWILYSCATLRSFSEAGKILRRVLRDTAQGEVQAESKSKARL